MNTLSKKITPFFFKEEIRQDCYSEVQSLWKELQKSKKESGGSLTLAHHILYAVLRGKDWRKCFTPVSSEVKLANGARADYTLSEAMYSLGRSGVYADFEPLIDTPFASNLVRSLLQGRRASAYNPVPLEELLREKLNV